MKPILIAMVAMVTIILLLSIAAANTDRECIRWAEPTPAPTPIPITTVYTEWIPFPGKGLNTGYGWIRVEDFLKAKAEWPPRNIQAHILQDNEYAIIEQEHGLRMTQGGREAFGFPPVQGFPRVMGGVLLKNTWLPERLQKVTNK